MWMRGAGHLDACVARRPLPPTSNKYTSPHPQGRTIYMSYIPNTPEDQQAMLATLGLSSLEELLTPVPEHVRLGRALDLPPALAEPDLKRLLGKMAAKNKNLDSMISFLGAGTYDHAVP